MAFAISEVPAPLRSNLAGGGAQTLYLLVVPDDPLNLRMGPALGLQG